MRNENVRRKPALLGVILLLAGLSQTQQPTGKSESSTSESAAQEYFTDTAVVDQDGQEQRFYTDLLKGKVVVINAMFASCKDSCPTIAAKLARIQKWLGPRLGTNVRLLSITVDPEADTPSILKQYGARFGAQPGWFFLTGKKQNVEFILRKLRLYAERKQDHATLFIIGNLPTGLWKKVLGSVDSEDLIGVLKSVLEDKGQ